MIKDFSKPSNKALANAIKIAGQLGHRSVGPEHLLVALCELEGSDANKILKKYSNRAYDMRAITAKKLGSGAETQLSERDISTELAGIINYAGVCSEILGDGCIGTEQLLAAMLQAESATVSLLLYEAGIREDNVRRECREAPKSPHRETAAEPERKSVPRGKFCEKYTVDLTDIARDHGFDEVVGREDEIDRVITILARRKKNSACLVGEPGVGKTAIAEGIAMCIVDVRVPPEMKNKRLVSLDISAMVAGTKYRGDFEERFKATLAEISKCGNIVVFIDEMHAIMGAGSAEGAVDAANILKPILSRSELQLIGATTEEEYARYVEKDRAFERRLLPVRVGEPGLDAVRMMLESQRPKLERHHRVAITASAVEGAIRLSRRYIHDRFLPDKALDLIDEAAAQKRLGKKSRRGEVLTITEREIAEVVSRWTRIPVTRIGEDERDHLLQLENRLREQILGQDRAVVSVARALCRARTGLKDPRRPSGCFLFCGPTGVGKTEVCRALAREMFGDEKSMLRFDMSEYMEKESVAKLIGAPPGYVGHKDGGQLTDALRKKPYSVVVFDEADKASAQVLNILLQIMEEGTLTDAQGRSVDCSNCIVILTANIGARHIAKEGVPLGFNGAVDSDTLMQQRVDAELKEAFAPEFLNRLDEIVVFNRLTQADLCRIAGLMMRQLAARIAEQDIELDWDAAVEQLLCCGSDFARYGARPMRREITKQVENPLADMILRGDLVPGSRIALSVRDGEIALQKTAPERAAVS